jgi:hypothetical protein
MAEQSNDDKKTEHDLRKQEENDKKTDAGRKQEENDKGH